MIILIRTILPMKLIKKIRISVILLLIAPLMIACNRQAKVDLEKSLPNEDLLSLAPADTLAFLTWDSTTPAFDAYRKTAWYQDPSKSLQDMEEHLDKSPEASELFKSVKPIIEALAGDEQSSGIDKLLLFVNPAEKSIITETADYQLKLAINLIGIAKDKDAATKLASRLYTNIEKNLKTGKTSFSDNCSGITAKSESSSITFYIAQKEDRLFATSNEAQLKSLCEDAKNINNENFNTKIKNTETFKNLKNTLLTRLAGNELLGLTYINLPLILKNVLVKPEAQKQAQIIPFGELLFSRGIAIQTKVVNDAHVIGLDLNNVNGKNWDQILTNVTKNSVTETIPQDAVIKTIISGPAMLEIAKAAYAESKPTNSGNFDSFFTALKDLKSFSTSIFLGDTQALVPNILIRLSGSNLKETFKLLSTEAKNGLTASGAASFGTWQNQTLEGREIEKFVTPFGIGVSLTADDNGIYMSTAETPLKAAFGLVENSDTLSLKEKSLMSFSLNFPQLVKLLKSADGSLGMFTGGQSIFGEAKVIDDLAKLGRVSGEVIFENANVSLLMNYSANEVK
jgi:hypothetical protein